MALPRDTPASSPPPSAFGRYRVVHQVGAGALGPVFRGYDPEYDRAVAIKAFSLDLTPEQARDLADDLGRLPTLPLKHPSIIMPFAGGADGSTVYLVQEYFVAESADVALKQYGPAPVPDAIRLIGQLAGALDFAAAAGVHHGALHPRDILVAPHEVRLSGLGVVEALERVGYRTPVRRPYAAPERASGGAFGSPADVFSLAGVSCELLTGRRPSLSGEAVAVETEAVPSADPAALAEVFARALSPSPDDRYSSALAFAAALKHALTGEPLVTGETTERPRARRAVRSASRKTPVPAHSTAAAVEAPSEEQAEAVEAAPVDEVPPGEPSPGELPILPNGDGGVAADERALAEEAEEALPAAPPPGSTPLPSFLESYRSAADVDGAGPAADAVTDRREPALPSPELDLAELDRRIELTTAVPVAIPEPSAAPAPEQGFSLAEPPPPNPDDFGHRVEPTLEVPVVRRMDPAPPPGEEPVQPTLRLEEPDRPAGLPREPAGELARATFTGPPGEARSKTSLASLLGMLLVGILIGFPSGYLVAPKGAPAPAAAAAQPAGGQPLATAAPADAVPTLPPPSAAGSPIPAPETSPAAAAVPPPSLAAEAAPAAPAPKTAPRGAATERAKTEPSRGDTGAAGQASPAARKKPASGRAVAFEGSLVIASKPDGATVRLDGHPVGTTPLTMKTLSAGSHAIRLELPGYQVWSSSVQVTAGKVNRVTASLERRPGG